MLMMFFVVADDDGSRTVRLISKHNTLANAKSNEARLNRVYKRRIFYTINQARYIDLYYTGEISDPNHIMRQWLTGD